MFTWRNGIGGASYHSLSALLPASFGGPLQLSGKAKKKGLSLCVWVSFNRDMHVS